MKPWQEQLASLLMQARLENLTWTEATEEIESMINSPFDGWMNPSEKGDAALKTPEWCVQATQEWLDYMRKHPRSKPRS